MTDKEIRIFLTKVDELIDQATKEKSHYYTKSVLMKCSTLITWLWDEHVKLEMIRSMIRD